MWTSGDRSREIQRKLVTGMKLTQRVDLKFWLHNLYNIDNVVWVSLTNGFAEESTRVLNNWKDQNEDITTLACSGFSSQLLTTMNGGPQRHHSAETTSSFYLTAPATHSRNRKNRVSIPLATMNSTFWHVINKPTTPHDVFRLLEIDDFIFWAHFERPSSFYGS